MLVEPQLENEIVTSHAPAQSRSAKSAATPRSGPQKPVERQPAAPFDRAHLAKFTFGDLAVETEILTLFAEQLPRLLTDLEEAGSQEDWTIAAHTLKGSSRAVGAWDLAAAAAQAESLGWHGPEEQTQSTEERDTVLERLQRLSSFALDYIEAEIG